jgi:hypothetical protein
MDAIYIISPLPYVVDCVIADMERPRYRRSFLVWTSLPDPGLRRRLESSPSARGQIAAFETLLVDFFPRESHLITFRDPYSFPILYHPGCDNLVRGHMQILAQKVGRCSYRLEGPVNSMLTLMLDNKCLRIPGGISQGSILSTKSRASRCQCPLYASGKICAGRT